jgi:hypothetical protein
VEGYDLAAPDELLLLLMYMLPESTRFSIGRGILLLVRPALETEASVLPRRRGVFSFSSARRRQRSLRSRSWLCRMRLRMVTMVLLDKERSSEATPRSDPSESRRDAEPRDSPEPNLPKRRVSLIDLI